MPGLPLTRSELRNRAFARRARAVRTDYGDDRLVCRELGRCGLPTFGTAAIILAVKLDVVAQDLAANIIHGEFGAVLGIQTQRRV